MGKSEVSLKAPKMTPNQLERYLGRTIPKHINVLVVGRPGIGKTQILDVSARKAGSDQVIFIHPVLSDPTDAKGFPWVTVNDNGVPKAMFIPFGDLELMINAKTLTTVFIDDLGQAPMTVQAAFMQLVHGGKVNGFKISPHVSFVAATNSREDKAGVTGVLEPLKTRFRIVHLETSMEDWMVWALQNGIRTEVIAYVKFKPDILTDFQPSFDLENSGCPRTVEALSELVDLELDKDLELPAYAGTVGMIHATQFMAFLKVYRDLPSIDGILMNPKTAKIPPDTNPAAMFALCAALAGKTDRKNIERVVQYVERIPTAFGAYLIRTAHMRDNSIENTRPFIEWTTSHQSVFCGSYQNL